jgi:uncharacterized protein (TIGR02996 family)
MPGSSLREALAAALAADPDDTASRMAFADYLTEQGEGPPAVAYRVDQEVSGDDEDIVPRLESFLADPAVGLVQALVIGWWGLDASDADSRGVVDALIATRDRLTSLRALFLGDITRQDNQISWINQSDLTGLLAAFPNLEHFRARGGAGLILDTFQHDHLESLGLEASNLPREVVRAVGASNLPALEYLELWLGTHSSGGNTEVGDLEGIFQAKRLPSLRYLGLRNCEIIDDVVCALAKAPVLERLCVLDLSLGNLSDRGVEALLAAPALARLEMLDIRHHYVSSALVASLRALGIHVDDGDRQEVDDPDDASAHRYIAHTE